MLDGVGWLDIVSVLSCLNLPIEDFLSRISSYLQSSSVTNGNLSSKSCHASKQGEILHSMLIWRIVMCCEYLNVKLT